MRTDSEVVDRKVITLAGRRVEVRMFKTHYGERSQAKFTPSVRFVREGPVCVCGEPLSWHEKFDSGECAMKGCRCTEFVNKEDRL